MSSQRLRAECNRKTQSWNSSLRASREQIKRLQGTLEAVCAESSTDALTKVANRKHFDQALDHAIDDASQSKTPLSLLLCDVDHFKTFNDTFGHIVGDHVLRLIATAIKQSVRGQDMPARYGGEEFAVILPSTTGRQALAVAENIRRAIAQRPLTKRSTGEMLGTITISAGIAEFRHGETAWSLIERADACLYAAKRAGRNCVKSELGFGAAPCNLGGLVRPVKRKQLMAGRGPLPDARVPRR